MRYRISSERIGRNHYVVPFDLEAADADDLAAKIHRYVKRPGLIMSSDFVVLVDLEKMTGSIGLGRFGSFTITEVKP